MRRCISRSRPDYPRTRWRLRCRSWRRGRLVPTLPALAQFREQLDRYRQVDSEILALAVENTNLKAQRLSFGPVHAAADELVSALDAAAAAVPRDQRWQAQALAAHAELRVREIQVPASTAHRGADRRRNGSAGSSDGGASRGG